jgi:sec-independent protein translocase protein TatA
MFGFGVMEILLVFALVVFFFGAKRIPQIAKGVGEGIRNFRHSVKEGKEGQDRLESGSEEDSRLNDGQDH